LSEHDTECFALFLTCDTALSRWASTTRDRLDQPREPTASAHAGQRCPPDQVRPTRAERVRADGEAQARLTIFRGWRQPDVVRRCAKWRADDKPGAGSRSSQAVNRAIARCGLEEWALLACTGGDSPHPGEDLARLAG
jgi:hypothetical protein